MNTSIKLGTILALIIGGLILMFFAIQKLAALIILVLIALIITTGIDPIVQRLQQFIARWWHMPRGMATILVLLFGILIILGALAFLTTTAINQAISFAHNERLQSQLYHWATDLSSRYSFIPRPEVAIERLKAQSGKFGSYLWQTTVALFGFIGSAFSIVTVFILSLFFTTYKSGITYTLMQLVQPAYQAETRRISHLAAEKMGGWLRGQLMLALIITTFIAIGMSALGYPAYAILVGIIGGIGELIPMVGPYLAFFPAIAIVLITGGATWQIVGVVAFFILLSQLENYVLAPKIMERQVGLHPVTTILALLFGGSLLGLVGALLAIPLAAGARVVFMEAIFPAIQHRTREQIEQQQPQELPGMTNRRRKRRNR